MLKNLDFSKPFQLQYFSRKILDCERNYSTIEKECLAIVLGIKAIATYLVGKPFILQTDHCALTWLRTLQDKNMRLTRCSLALQSYTFEIQHRKGRDNANADALSRLPGKVETDQCFALEKEGSNVTDNICRASGSLNQERSRPITRQERRFQSGPVIPSDPALDYIKN